MSDPRNQPPLSGTEMLGFGAFLAAAVVLPLVAGLAADGHFHSAPWGVAAGLLVGIVAACCVFYVRFKRYW